MQSCIHPARSHATCTYALSLSADTSVRSKISEPSHAVRMISAMATSSDGRWIALAEFMTGGRGPQITLLDAHR